ncbi:MAG TPA: plastocyanin/azurin family copper-binding protein [Membranihabitans sp.]|nr:plastocyanin/azurin family copper-binding protein [Membranihabitans sp.]
MRLYIFLCFSIACLHTFTPSLVWASHEVDIQPDFIKGNDLIHPYFAEKVVDTQFIEMGVIVGQMKFDKTQFTVKAGQPVAIVFKNNDVMLHNILILKPGTLGEVGMAADKMITDPKGQEKGYIPESDAVLYTTPLVNPGKTYTLKFTAPEKKGEYPYVCTFPGHWRLMKGVMKVE